MGIATAHQMYHPIPLNDIDRYYGGIRPGRACLGGTDLPATKAETLDCLRSYLPRLALTHGAALATGEALMNNPGCRTRSSSSTGPSGMPCPIGRRRW